MEALLAPDPALVVAALRARLVPEEVASAGARVAHDETGVHIAPEVPIGDRVAERLCAAGFLPSARSLEGEGVRRVGSWMEIPPCVRIALPDPPLGEVLFVTAPGEPTLAVASELLRLGCERQALCAVRGEEGERVLVRAADPPYYAVLRALETGTAYAPVRTASRIYVELGWAHPLADRLREPDEGLLLVRASEPWLRAPDGPWTDLLDSAELVVPAHRTLSSAPSTVRLRVSLSLRQGARRERPCLWVLRERADEALEALVSTAPAAVIDALDFARLEGEDGEAIVVLRARGEVDLELDAEALAPHPRIAHLFVPVGTSIEPPLSAERLRALLAPDEEAIVWARAHGGSIALESARRESFSPLADWVEHVVERDAGVLRAWADAATFAFEPFVVEREVPSGASRAPAAASASPSRRAAAKPGSAAPELPLDDPGALPEPPPPVVLPPEPAPSPRASAGDDPRARAAAALAQAFRTSSLPFDAPERASMWAELAEAEAAAGHFDDASLCWTRAFELAADRAALARRWAEAERAAPERPHALVAALAAGRAGLGAEGALAAVGAAAVSLDARSLWTAHHAIASRTRDKLALVRARDAIIERLRGGLSLARDVPRFVRAGASGVVVADRLGAELERLEARYASTERARSPIEAPEALTGAYVRLTFAWAHARLGRREAARERTESALATLSNLDAVHTALRAMYRIRIEQALEGIFAGAPLDAARLSGQRYLGRMSAYKIDRLRQCSRVLEPSGQTDAFARFAHAESLLRPFARRDASQPPEVIDATLGAMLARAREAEADHAALLLHAALEAVGNLPLHLAAPRLDDVLAASEALDPARRLALASAVIGAAAEHEREASIDAGLRVIERLGAERIVPRDALAAALARTLPALTRAGLRDRAHALLDRTLRRLPPSDLVSRLALASALASAGTPAHLAPALEAALAALDTERGEARLRLAEAIAPAAAQSGAERAIEVAGVLFDHLATVTDSLNTNSHYCLSVVRWVESAARCLAREDLMLDDWARTFLDEDEHMLRRRMRKELAQLTEAS